ncbi:agmatine deiminase family protein [Ferrimonas balearica]|uniref:agmatine deiminase family protein n=1 Tax=Ferrimonas balearica TaxID=44012 RepID=UPI001C945DE2|nr:agmatine deiminase family protein [Ferrimonas balearica]MBY6105329.1 agmatine deiminase family protein [Ferrimonas balearica]
METPTQQGFFMPAEWHPHQACWMAWPCNPPVFNGQFEAAQREYAAVAQAIARFEPVIMLVRPEDEAEARAMCGTGIELKLMPLDDSWFRDNGPTFLLHPDGRCVAVDWEFNGWGEDYAYSRDRLVARQLLADLSMTRFVGPQVLEGGSFHVDGEGTVMVTRQCLLNPNRNPGLGQESIEANLKSYLNVQKVIWLDQGLKDDPTDGHVDMLACFLAPGIVMALVSRDPADENYPALAANLATLKESRDAKGRALIVIEVEQPPARHMADGTRLGLSYINFYRANGAVVIPQFGDPDYDARARAVFEAQFPHLEVVGVPSLAILHGGGNIHCITQQQPQPLNKERS